MVTGGSFDVFEPHHDEHEGRGYNFKPTDTHPSLRGPHGCDNPLIAFSAKDHGADALDDCSPTLRAGGFDKSHANSGNWVALHSGMSVRRLTPRECERLQGFPDDWTLVQYNGKPAADGPRYKALGNAVTVNVAHWIGRRIVEAEQ